jgi:hypothetical protein
MKKQPKKKFVFKISEHQIVLYRRNKRNRDNHECILDIWLGALDCDKSVEIIFGTHCDIVPDVNVKSEYYLKYIRKMSRALFALTKVFEEVEKWES